MKRSPGKLLILGIIFVTLAIRGPITSVGPVVDLIKADFYLSNGVAGMITTLPLMAFAVVSSFIARISSRFTYGWTMFYGLLLIILGELLRFYGGVWLLFIGTALMGIGITAGNVLLPSVIKLKFPENIGKITSIYTSCMCISSSIGAGISVPLAINAGWGWRGAISIWLVVAVIGLIFWLPQIGKRRIDHSSFTNLACQEEHMINQESKSCRTISIWRSAIAWQVTIFMGLQSLLFFCLVAWFPSIVVAKGMSTEFAGYIALTFQILNLPSIIIVSIIAPRLKDQRVISVLLVIGYLLGMFILLMANSATTIIISTLLMSLTAGGILSLSILFFSLRTQNAARAAELSGMAQTVGYLLAAFGPTMMGAINDVTGSWDIPVTLFCLFIVIMIFFGLKAGKDVTVSEKLAQSTGN